MDNLKNLTQDAEKAIAGADSLDLLDKLRVQYLGKKGLLTDQLKQLGKLPAEERPQAGQEINKSKKALQTLIEARKQALQNEVMNARLTSESIDVTLPGRGSRSGGRHPVSRTLERIENLFAQLGF